MVIRQEVEHLHIKMNNLTLTNIQKDGYKATLENVYSQAKRTNTLKMVKVLIGQVYTLSVTLIDVQSPLMQQIQQIALLPEITVEFYDENTRKYITQNMYCTTVKKTVKRQINDNTMLYDTVTLDFVANDKYKA